MHTYIAIHPSPEHVILRVGVRSRLRPLIITSLTLSILPNSIAEDSDKLPKPPPTRKVDHVDTYHGVKVEDRGLEIDAGSTSIYQVGKRKFSRVSLT